MSLEIAPDRPLARLLVNAVTMGAAGLLPSGRYVYVPPDRADTDRPGAVSADGPSREAVVEGQCMRVLRGLLLGEALDVTKVLHPDVVLWSPAMCATSRAVAAKALRHVVAGDTLTDVSITAVTFELAGPHAYLEWRLRGRFTNPCFVDDDLLVEPTGRMVETAGVLVVTRLDGLVTEAHCYYDDFALLEQLLMTA